jgi:transcription antitermination factor NusG
MELNTMFAEERTLWYALHVRTRFEKVVSRNLKGKGYEEFLPLYKRTSRWSDRTKEIELPLFPGYVFCRFNPLERLPILQIPGVNSVVGFGKDFLPVEDAELNAVRFVLSSGSLCEPWPFLTIGQRVRVEYGPLAGMEGLVTNVKNACRLVISVNMLQRSVGVEIDRDCLTPIPDNAPNKIASPKNNPDMSIDTLDGFSSARFHRR